MPRWRELADQYHPRALESDSPKTPSGRERSIPLQTTAFAAPENFTFLDDGDIATVEAAALQFVPGSRWRRKRSAPAAVT